MNCYFDGSVGGDSDQWLTLAGLIASDWTWAIFQKQWQIMLRERYPIAPYIHMTALITGNDPFELVAGWTECRVDRLVSDAEGVLNSADKKHICAFACSIDVSAHSRLIDEGYNISDPAVICAEIGIGQLLTRYRDKHSLEMAHLFYEQDEPFIGSIRKRWRKRVVMPNKLVTNELFWGSIGSVQPVDMRDTPGIQAADMVGWSVTRRLRYGLPEDKWAPLANSLVGTRDFPGILPSTQLDPIDESVMRSKYSKTRT